MFPECAVSGNDHLGDKVVKEMSPGDESVEFSVDVLSVFGRDSVHSM